MVNGSIAMEFAIEHNLKVLKEQPADAVSAKTGGSNRHPLHGQWRCQDLRLGRSPSQFYKPYRMPASDQLANG